MSWNNPKQKLEQVLFLAQLQTKAQTGPFLGAAADKSLNRLVSAAPLPAGTIPASISGNKTTSLTTVA
jgi:hypothetical protein